jgi:hypothetical protein
MNLIESNLNIQVAKLEQFDNGEWVPDYCTDWGAGGPIIEHEGINLRRSFDGDGWTASVWRNNTTIFEHGETALVAAMRCYVAMSEL